MTTMTKMSIILSVTPRHTRILATAPRLLFARESGNDALDARNAVPPPYPRMVTIMGTRGTKTAKYCARAARKIPFDPTPLCLYLYLRPILIRCLCLVLMVVIQRLSLFLFRAHDRTIIIINYNSNNLVTINSNNILYLINRSRKRQRSNQDHPQFLSCQEFL